MSSSILDLVADGYYARPQPGLPWPVGRMRVPAPRRRAPATDPRRFFGFPPSAVYAPVPYIPSAAAIRAARATGLSVLATLWLARFAGLFTYIAIVAWAIVRIPRWRNVLAIVALMPVCVFQAAMVSATE